MQVAEHDVLVIGAGGAGLRAAIEASAAGASVGLVTKSLLGKAHTVMAEGGIAAAARQRGRPRRLADPLRRHHARRAVRQQPDDGRAPRQGGPGPGPGTRGLGGGVRPDERPEDPPAQLRRPQVPAARPRRRPDRARDDPHPPGPRHPPGDRRPHGVDGDAADPGRRPGGRRLRLRPREGPLPGVPGLRGGARHRRDRPGLPDHLQQLGVHRRRPRARLRGGGRAHRHGVRPVPSHRDGLAAERPRHPGDRGSARGGRRPPQQRRPAVHVRRHPRPLPGIDGEPTRRRAGATPRATRRPAGRPSSSPATTSPAASCGRSRRAGAARTAACSSTSPGSGRS